MFNKERGITLVALVVTIIVLLILAGVTITLALSNRGVIKQAQNASSTWSEAEDNEAKALNYADEYAGNMYNQYVVKNP